MTGVPVATAPAIIGLPRIISLMLFIFSIFGLWNPHSSRLYAIYSYTLHFTCTFLYTISLVAGVLTLNTTEELIAASSMTLTMVATCVLVGNMYVYNGQIRQLLRRISDFPLKDGDANERAIVQRCSSFFTMVASSLYVLANMAASSQNLAALLKGRLPFVAVFPAVDRFHSFWYLYQSGGMTMMSNVNITLQMFPDYLMYMCSAQFQLLDARLRALGRGCRAHPNFGVSVPEMPDQAAARRELIVCIRTHQEIIECVDAVQNLFGFSFFVQTTAMAAISGASAVQLTMSSPKNDPVGYTYFVCFAVAITSVSSLPCFFGNEVMIRSDRLSSAAYFSDWMQMSARYRRVLNVFMERLKRPSVIRACKMIPLVLETFRSIMSFTYKLYALVVNNN